MHRKSQQTKQLQGNPKGRSLWRRALAWMLCVALVFDGIWVPEAGRRVQAAEAEETTMQEAAEMSEEMPVKAAEPTGISAQEAELTVEAEPTAEAEEISAEEPAEEYDSLWDAADVSAGDSVSDNAVTAVTLSDAEDDIASGTYENITWRIDANGKLTVEGTGEFSASEEYDRAPWYSEREAVKTAEIRISGLRDASYMFAGCSNLTDLDLSGFDMSNVTSMSSMFSGCSVLESLDLSGFDTSSVTSMSWMFYDCSSLTSVDMSGLDMSNVTSISSMFRDCSSLTSVNMSGLNMSSVTSISEMFRGCSRLTSVNMSGSDMSSLTSMSYMFGKCGSLTSVDLNGLNASSVTSISRMFEECSSLTSVNMSGIGLSSLTSIRGLCSGCSSLTSVDMSGADLSRVTDISYLFELCSSLASVNMSGLDMSSLTDMSYMFRGYSSLTSVDMSGADLSSVTVMSMMFYNCSRLTSVNMSGTNLSSVTDISNLFACGSLTSVDLSGADMSSVTDMSGMFRRHNALTSVDMSGLKMGSVTDMSEMFYDCSKLTSVSLSGFDTSHVTDMSGMFYNCRSLTSVDLSGFDTSHVTSMSEMFRDCRSLTSLDVSGFDTSSVTDMNGMFYYCSELTSLDVSGFDTSSVTSMSEMFRDCRSLTSLDVSGFDTSSVTDMNSMFYYCGVLESVDVSGLDMSSVTSMSGMFRYCSSLTSMNMSGLDMSSVTSMSEIFRGCSSLTSVDMSGVDLSSLTSVNWMFEECSNLTSVNLSGADMGSVTNIGGMFEKCSSLTSVDMSGADMGSVTNISGMFRYCSSLTSVDMSGADMSSVTDMSGMFKGLSVISVNLNGLDVSSVTNMSDMFSGCNSLTSLDVSGFDTSSVTNMSGMFSGCNSLASLDMSGFNTSSVTHMGGMFHDCNRLTSLNVSGFDTSSVTSMRYMFYNCSSLTSLDVSGFDTSSVTDMSEMFWNCNKLTSVDVSGFETSSVTDMSGMFSSCSSLTSLDVSGFDTGSVTDMSSMFFGCSSLTSLDMSGFNTSSVTSMREMFRGCSKLKSVDLSRFDTSSVTDMRYMFYNCRGLTSLDLSGFDTSSVISMSYMFYNCSKLKSVDLSRFDTSRVTEMSEMFRHCDKLESLDMSGFDMSHVSDIGEKFFSNGGAMGLTMIYTPYNVPANLWIELPINSGAWYDSTGTGYDYLPRGLDHSIVLMRDKKPDAAMPSRLTVRLAKSVYEPGSVINPKDLTVKYRGTDGKTVVLSCKSDNSAGYTMSDVDMSTPGVKTLTVSYNDGTDTLTESVTFTVLALLTDAMVTLPEGEYVYNGKAHEPVPIVKSADGVPLTRGKDYVVSYTDNINAGEAVISVTGRNAYGGTVTKNFTVQKATLADVEIRFSELCEKANKLHMRQISGYFNDKTVPNCGTIEYAIGEITEHDSVDAGSVLSGTPEIYTDKSQITYIIYDTNTGTAGDTVSIPVIVTFGMNYKDAVIHVTIGLKEKRDVSISGIAMKKKHIYNGSPVAPKGTATVRTEDESETDVTDLVTLTFHYTGTQSDGTAYDSDTAPTRPGSYILRVAVAENDLYEGSAEYPFAISKVPLTVTASNVTLEIGTFDALPDEGVLPYEITGFFGTHTAQEVLSAMPVVAYGLNGKKINKASVAIDKAGTYELIPSGAVLNQAFSEEYEITARSYRKGTLTIVESGSGGPANPDDPANPDNPTKPDNPKDPEIPDDGNFRVSAVPAQTYTGSAIKPAVTVYYGSRRLTEKTDYTVTYKNNIKVNDDTQGKSAPTIIITGKGNYSGKQTITFVIKPKSIAEEDVTAAELIAAQSGKVQKPVPTLTWQGKKLKNKTDFTVSYPDEKTGAYQTAGTYAVTVTGTGNYTGTKNLTFTITNKTLLAKAKVTVKAKDYTGSAVTLNTDDITVKVGNTTLAYGTDYTLSYRNNIQVGKATVIVTGAGDDYAGSKEAAFQIKGESIAKAQITGIVDKTYTGTAQTQDIQVQLNGKTLEAGRDYTVSYAKEVNAGTATVTVTGKGGYTGSVKKSFKITAFDLQTNEGGKLQGIPQSLTTAYTKGGATPALILTFNGKSLAAKKDYTVTYKNNKNPASASDAKAPVMVIKGKGNFKGTISIPFAITVSNLEPDGNVTITAADTAYVNKAGKYMVKPVLTDVNGKKLTAGTDYEKTFTYTLVNTDGTEKALTAADIVPEKSTVKVTVNGKGNYTGTLSTTYRITKTSFAKAKITIKPQAYKGGAVTLSAEDITVKLGNDTLTYGTDYTIVEGSYKNNIKKGTATVTVKGIGNYGGTKTAKFMILAKALAALLKF